MSEGARTSVEFIVGELRNITTAHTTVLLPLSLLLGDTRSGRSDYGNGRSASSTSGGSGRSVQNVGGRSVGAVSGRHGSASGGSGRSAQGVGGRSAGSTNGSWRLLSGRLCGHGLPFVTAGTPTPFLKSTT